ncbi:MAG TPA: phosphoribosylanthranilate isomerase [Syntrophomonadaceae bacterium]|nr:phosphoribosylanthranilate isomerase [Syntrophomonadaceae bacterium]
MTLVKICGIKNLNEARAAQAAGAWAIGQVFAPSSRQISPDEAAFINTQLSGGVLKIGVFVNEQLETVRRLIDFCHLDAVQLHGDESAEYLEEIQVPVIKSFPVRGTMDIGFLKRWRPWAYHFDSFRSGPIRGGSGSVFNWSWLENLPEGTKMIISGGLNSDNVSSLIKQMKPWAVDISSGVEFPGGGKDPAAIIEFINKVREADGDDA